MSHLLQKYNVFSLIKLSVICLISVTIVGCSTIPVNSSENYSPSKNILKNHQGEIYAYLKNKGWAATVEGYKEGVDDYFTQYAGNWVLTNYSRQADISLTCDIGHQGITNCSDVLSSCELSSQRRGENYGALTLVTKSQACFRGGDYEAYKAQGHNNALLISKKATELLSSNPVFLSDLRKYIKVKDPEELEWQKTSKVKIFLDDESIESIADELPAEAAIRYLNMQLKGHIFYQCKKFTLEGVYLNNTQLITYSGRQHIALTKFDDRVKISILEGKPKEWNAGNSCYLSTVYEQQAFNKILAALYSLGITRVEKI